MEHQQEPVKFNYVVLRLGRQCCCALRVRSMVEVWQQFTTMLSGVGSSLGSGWGGGRWEQPVSLESKVSASQSIAAQVL